jgi:hypothetical protein
MVVVIRIKLREAKRIYRSGNEPGAGQENE